MYETQLYESIRQSDALENILREAAGILWISLKNKPQVEKLREMSAPPREYPPPLP